MHETRKDNNILIRVKITPSATPKLNLAILTDWYWPCKGGVERAAQALATSLQKSFSVTVITHRVSDNSSLYSTYTSNKRQLLKDPDGNRISLLEPSIAGRILLAPLMIWNMPVPRSKHCMTPLPFLQAAFSKRLRNYLSYLNRPLFLNGISCTMRIGGMQKSDLPLVHSLYPFRRWDSPAQLTLTAEQGLSSSNRVLP